MEKAKSIFDIIFKTCLIAVLSALVYVIHQSVEQTRYKPLPSTIQFPIFDSRDNKVYHYQQDIGFFYTVPGKNDVEIRSLPK